MGFFSWKTADTKKSIRNRLATGFKRQKAVCLLQPNGLPPIVEAAYEGYGIFGGVDAFVWLAEQNLSQEMLEQMNEVERRNAGISMTSGSYVLDHNTGKTYSVFHPVIGMPGVEHLDVTWDAPLSQFGGKSANDLVIEKRFLLQEVPTPSVPLKFSFNPKAKYEDLPASEVCPHQGYFYI